MDSVVLILALLVVLLIAWFLGIGQFVHGNATLQVAGGLQTVLVVLIIALVAMVFRQRPFRT